MRVVTILVLFIPLAAIANPSFPPGDVGYNKAIDSTMQGYIKTLKEKCPKSKDQMAFALSHNQHANSQCEIVNTISQACYHYAEQAGSFLMLMRKGDYSSDQIFNSLFNGHLENGDIEGWESATYAPKSLTGGDLFYIDFKACMAQAGYHVGHKK